MCSNELKSSTGSKFRDKCFKILQNKLFEQYRGKRIALYGVGKHTQLIIEAIDFSKFNIIGLIDRNVDNGHEIKYGYKVYTLDAIADKLDIIIISSDTYQEVIYERLKDIEKRGTEIIKIYSDELKRQEKFWSILHIKLLERFRGKRIAFYGVGKHTEILLKSIDFSEFNVLGLIDQNVPNDGAFKYGYKLYELEQIANRLDVIVISSETHQEVIYERIKYLEEFGVEVIKIYMDDPFFDNLIMEEKPRLNNKKIEFKFNGQASVVGIGFTFRTIDNYLPVLDKFKDAGYSVNLVVFPNKQDSNHYKIKNIRYHNFCNYPIGKLNSLDELSLEDLSQIIMRVCKYLKPKVILIDDLMHYPSNGVKRAVNLLDFSEKPIVIGFQHGFYQPWEQYNSFFACDYFFCFGEKHKQCFDKVYQSQIFATGLSKIDRLHGLKVTNENFILFASQDEWSMQSWQKNDKDVYTLLTEVSLLSGLPVKIKPHPEYSNIPENVKEQFEIFDPQSNIIDMISKATYVITTGSTAAIESLVLGKPTAILPSNTACVYEGCPALVEMYSAKNVLNLLNNYEAKKCAVENYLDEVLSNWRNFDSAEQTYILIKDLINKQGE